MPRPSMTRRGLALVVEHLTKRFVDRVAFDDGSFEVGHGKVFGLLGPIGAGKTTPGHPVARGLGDLGGDRGLRPLHGRARSPVAERARDRAAAGTLRAAIMIACGLKGIWSLKPIVQAEKEKWKEVPL